MALTDRHAVLGIAALALAGALAPAAPDPTAANQALAKEQVKLAEEAQLLVIRLYQAGQLSPRDSQFALWARRKVEATRAAGAGKAEMVSALEEYIKTLKTLEALAAQAKEAARGTELAVLDARYRRLEAEIWLNREKAK